MVHEIDGIELVTFDYFAHKLPDSSSRNVEHLSKKGKFPTYVRLSERGPARWRRDLVDEWFEKVLAPILAARAAGA